MRISRFFRSIFQQDGTIEKRLFWVIALMATFAELLFVVVDQVNGLGSMMLFIETAAVFMTLVTMTAAWFTGKYGVCYLILCLILNLVVLPMAFINSGGFYSGVPCFIFGGLFMCAVSPDTKKRFIAFGASVLGYALLFFLTLRHPEIITPFSEDVIVRDRLFAVLIAAVVFMVTITLLVNSLRDIYEMNIRKYEEKTRMRMDLLESQAESIEDAKHMRNEMRRHNMIISEYAEKGDFDGLLEYLKVKQDGDDHHSKKIYCMNTMINSVLGIYADQAMEKKVPMEISTDVPQQLPISEPDLVSIVSNILEIAINGTEQAGTPDRPVTLDIHMKNGKFVVNCRYSCMPETDGHKEYSGNTAISMEIVKRIVNAYDGIMDFGVENGTAHCRLVITVGAGNKR